MPTLKPCRTCGKPQAKAQCDACSAGARASGYDSSEYRAARQDMLARAKAYYDAGGWVLCGICYHPVIAACDISIDHIVTLAEGGSHSRENLRYAHGACNSRRGAERSSS